MPTKRQADNRTDEEKSASREESARFKEQMSAVLKGTKVQLSVIDDAFFGRLRELFSDEEILDLTLCVAVFLGLGRSLTVLGVDQSCAIDV